MSQQADFNASHELMLDQPVEALAPVLVEKIVAQLTQIGATDNGSICCLALTERDLEVRDLFVR